MSRGLLSLLAIVFGLLVLLTITFLVAESIGWTDGGWLRGELTSFAAGHGAAAAGCLVGLLLAADLFLPIPSSVLMTVAGALVGVAAGTAVNFAGAMASAVVGFTLCRRFGRTAFVRLVGAEAARVEGWIERQGAWAIILSRSVPMVTEVVSCLAGLGSMRPVRFVALTAAGTLPVSFVYAWAGATSRAEASLLWPLVVAFLVPAVGFALVSAAPRRGGQSPSASSRNSSSSST